MKKLILLFSISVLMFSAKAQEPTLSQKENYPLLLNPALTGTGQCDNRISGGFRGQWLSVPVSYFTGLISYDRRLFQSSEGLIMGLGGIFLLDRAGEGTFSTYKPELTFSVGQYFGKNRRQLVTGGISVGGVFHNIDYSSLKFDNQYTGSIYDTDLSNGELLNSKESYLYLNAGLNFLFQYGKKSNLSAGVSFSNINSPELTFQKMSGLGNYSIPVRYLAHIGGQQFFNEKWGVAPYGFYQRQGKQQEVLVKAEGLYAVDENILVGFGPGYRTNDAVILYASLAYKQTKFGVSFDLNTSDYATATNTNGAIEVSITHNICKKVKAVSPKDFTETPVSFEETPDTTVTAVTEEPEEKIEEQPITPVVVEEKVTPPSIPVEPAKPVAPAPVVETPLSIAPFNLYFNNAEPRDNSQNYAYWFKRVPNSELTDFYETDISTGFKALEASAETLKIAVNAGYKIKITLTGYASPLGNAVYNQQLVDRRIASILAYLGNSIDLKNVKIVKENKGEVESVNDDPSKPELSVKSQDAAAARKVKVSISLTK
jgi:type IX secretion system PorP/SprF family membrane protein